MDIYAYIYVQYISSKFNRFSIDPSENNNSNNNDNKNNEKRILRNFKKRKETEQIIIFPRSWLRNHDLSLLFLIRFDLNNEQKKSGKNVK